MTSRRLRHKLGGEQGEAAIVSGVLLLAGVLIPLLFLIALYARVEMAQVDAQQAARDAVRSAVQAPNPTAAHVAASTAVAREQAKTNIPLRLSLTGAFSRGQVMSAQVTARVPIGSLPLLGHFGTVTIHGRASAPVDRYRSILEEGTPP
jgi:Flp pilus assembly protein TadG